MSIKAVDLNFVYGGGTAFEQHALFDVNLEIQDGEFIGLIGHTGSGKSTLIQHLNGLIRASAGQLYYNGENIYDSGYDMKKLRSKVGLVFQYTLNTSCLRWMSCPTYVLDLRTRDLIRKRQRPGPKKRLSWWDWMLPIINSPHLNYPEDRSAAWQVQGCWPWNRRC